MEKHGGNVTAFAKKIGCSVEEIIDLSSNINFVKPKIDIDFNRLNVSSYPNYDLLYQSIATRYQLKTSQIELFNGATVAIHTLFRELKLNHCILYAPLYGEYNHSAKTYGYTVEMINRFNTIEEDIKENTLVIFVNPSTPDGEFYQLDKLMQKWIDKRCTILIDESFLDFTPHDSMIKYISTYEKLYILKSMTKFYSSAGIRIGAIFSNEKSIKKLKEKEPLWKISEFDSQYLQSALQDRSFIKKSNQNNNHAKEELITFLEKLSFIKKVYPSTANFILIELKGINTKELQKRLSSSKIMVRNCENFDFLDNSFIRIAIKEPSKLNILKDKLSKISI